MQCSRFATLLGWDSQFWIDCNSSRDPPSFSWDQTALAIMNQTLVWKRELVQRYARMGLAFCGRIYLHSTVATRLSRQLSVTTNLDRGGSCFSRSVLLTECPPLTRGLGNLRSSMEYQQFEWRGWFRNTTRYKDQTDLMHNTKLTPLIPEAESIGVVDLSKNPMLPDSTD